jgi:hypothetical protein
LVIGRFWIWKNFILGIKIMYVITYAFTYSGEINNSPGLKISFTGLSDIMLMSDDLSFSLLGSKSE